MTGPAVGRLRAKHRAETVNDATVIEKSWSDPAQFGVLFDKYAPLIYRYIVRRVGRPGTDDLVAETFVAAFDGRHRYDPARSDARPWLYGIATNIIGRHRRDELRQLRISQAIDARAIVPGHADRVALDTTAQSLRGDLTIALAGLAEGDRDVLVLVAWEDLTYEEVSYALAIPVGTVRSRLHRARRQLRLVFDQPITTTTVKEVLTND
jgi:RNA polymerase sigma factor (sigma-70 family)